MTRTFEDAPAKREQTPCLVGIVGPSGTGKTFSALRLATGMQRVSGGEIGFIDTEARRALHYADQFKFRHLEFRAPFDSLSYLAAIQHFVNKGCKIIIVDSMSHEHEGAGGMLEQAGFGMGGGVKFDAWLKPKAARVKMIGGILQTNANMIFCFRAKEKLKIIKGKDPEQRGYQPIAGEEFLFEMMINFMLLPGAVGHPSWQSEIRDEQAVMKLPTQFYSMFTKDIQLDEATGEAMVRWCAGGATAKAPKPDPLVKAFAALGITDEQVIAYLGHPLPPNTKDEVDRLTAIGKAIKAGEGTWEALTLPPADQPDNGSDNPDEGP